MRVNQLYLMISELSIMCSYDKSSIDVALMTLQASNEYWWP